MRKILLTIIVLALLLPSTANAGVRAQEVATDYWQARGYSQCVDVPIEIRWHAGFIPGTHTVGSAPLNGCERGYHWVNISRRIMGDSWKRRCRLFVHEYGHLVGLNHSDGELFPIMRGSTSSARVPECRVRHSFKMKGVVR